MERAEHKRVSVWGLDVHYVQAPSGVSGPEKPVVVLLHGLGTSLITWYCNIDPLVDAGFTVIAPDLPGFGDSDKPDHLDYAPASAAKFIYYLAQALKLEKFSLVGNSAGCVVAGLFALEHPEMVEKMALIAPGGFGRRATWFLRLVSVPLLGELIYRPWFTERAETTRYMFHRPPPILEELFPELLRIKRMPGTRMAMLKSIRSSINIRGLRPEGYILDRLKDCQVPLMTIWGEEDVIIPVAHAEVVRRQLPESSLHIIPECGHWPHMEKPDVVNAMLTEFLLSGPAGR